MKKNGMVISILLVLAILTTLISGCGSGTKDNSTSSVSTSSTTEQQEATSVENPYQEHMDISLSFWEVSKALADPSKDAFFDKVQKDFNVTLKPVNVTWSDWQEKNKLWAASGELPDMFVDVLSATGPVYNGWVSGGLIRALPDDMSKYPNLLKALESPDVKDVIKYKDGKYYMMPRVTYNSTDDWACDRGMLVRKDWMEKLGMSDPKNLDEFIALMDAFTTKDPDGNGKNDTSGLGVVNSAFLTELSFSTTLPQVGNGSWVKENGKWIPYYASTKYPDVVKMFRRLYAEGGIDKDFSILKDPAPLERFAQGKTGAFATGVYPPSMKKLSDLWNKYNPDKKFLDCVKILHQWPNSEGDIYHLTTGTYWSEWYFNKNVDDKKMDRILRILDYFGSPEGLAASRNGIEGTDYKKEGDKVVITRTKDSSGGYPALNTIYPSVDLFANFTTWYQNYYYVIDETNKSTYGEQNQQVAVDEFNWQKKNTKAIPTNFIVNNIDVPMKAKYNVDPTQDLVKIMLSSEDPVKMLQDDLKAYEAKGLSKLIEEVNAEAAKLGQ